MTTTGCDTCRISSRNLSGVMWLLGILRKLRDVSWGGASVNLVPASFVFGDAGSKGACVDDFVSTTVPAALFNGSICTTAGVSMLDKVTRRLQELTPCRNLTIQSDLVVRSDFLACADRYDRVPADSIAANWDSGRP
ncbi:hypothetical protein SUNI508_10240 [Seiridium unicorne]|uniref:Uncharacterized protein n=1 Tax=Seiridium unicorne TaxID=138068 RepID=A0ABR2UM96_9PEZI